MGTSVLDKLIRVRTVSNWAAAVIWIASFTIATPAQASNPWGRAVGEAQCLHDVTEDLENRTHRLFPNSPATSWTCLLDDAACQLLEMVKCGADWGQLQTALGSFQELNTHVCQLVASDCHMVRDRTIANYLRMVDDRYGDLVRDLSKCKPPVPSCNSPYSSHYHPSHPFPYPQSGLGGIPRIPQPVPSPGEAYNFDPRFVNPNGHPSIPRQWQGSVPRDSYYPRSTYDFEATPSNRGNLTQSQFGNLVPVDRRSVESQSFERPVASEILSLLLSRALR